MIVETNYRNSLHAVQGFFVSLRIRLVEFTLLGPHYNTICRRQRRLLILLFLSSGSRPRHVVYSEFNEY
ncbi:hypothetical protein [Candidatus Nitrospira salsa]